MKKEIITRTILIISSIALILLNLSGILAAFLNQFTGAYHEFSEVWHHYFLALISIPFGIFAITKAVNKKDSRVIRDDFSDD